MTTIIIIVVVALVFLSTVSVIAFKIWKKEADRRAENFRAIEHNLEILGYTMMDYINLKSKESEIDPRKTVQETVKYNDVPTNNRESQDTKVNMPNAGVDESTFNAPYEATDNIEQQIEPEYGEISFDFIGETEDTDGATEMSMGYDIGRSGKKYTALELETLIKE